MIYTPNMEDKPGWLYSCGYFYEPVLKNNKKVLLVAHKDHEYVDGCVLNFERNMEKPYEFGEEEDSYEVDWSICPQALWWVEKNGSAFFMGVLHQWLSDGQLVWGAFKVEDTTYKGGAGCGGEVVFRF